MRIQCKVMERLNRALETIKLLRHGCQIVNRVLNRAPMNEEGFVLQLSEVDSKEK
jgi:hypothetical protein